MGSEDILFYWNLESHTEAAGTTGVTPGTALGDEIRSRATHLCADRQTHLQKHGSMQKVLGVTSAPISAFISPSKNFGCGRAVALGAVALGAAPTTPETGQRDAWSESRGGGEDGVYLVWGGRDHDEEHGSCV